MKGMQNRRTVMIAVAAGLLLAGVARGEDLVTLSGTTYHDVRPLRVEPDGVTWEYAEGVCKVDFSDSPKSVCQAYHYDPAKAAAYHDAFTRQRKEANDRAQQVLKENDDRKLARLQASAAAMSSRAAPGPELTFRRSTSPAASDATRALDAQIEARAAKAAAAPSGVYGILANSLAGKILAGSGLVDFNRPVVLTNPDAIAALNRTEEKSSIHHAPGGFAPDAAHDSFNTPEYQTKSYYEDTDRAGAFARGIPLRP